MGYLGAFRSRHADGLVWAVLLAPGLLLVALPLLALATFVILQLAVDNPALAVALPCALGIALGLMQRPATPGPLTEGARWRLALAALLVAAAGLVLAETFAREIFIGASECGDCGDPPNVISKLTTFWLILSPACVLSALAAYAAVTASPRLRSAFLATAAIVAAEAVIIPVLIFGFGATP
jgi:hypothetical protein